MTIFVICVGSSLLSKTTDVTHSSKHPNSKGVVYYDKEDGNKPHILLVTTRHIDALEEITFKYGHF